MFPWFQVPETDHTFDAIALFFWFDLWLYPDARVKHAHEREEGAH